MTLFQLLRLLLMPLLHLLASGIVSALLRELLVFFILLLLEFLLLFLLLGVKLVLIFLVYLVHFGITAVHRSRTFRAGNVVRVEHIAAGVSASACVSRPSVNFATFARLHTAVTTKLSRAWCGG